MKTLITIFMGLSIASIAYAVDVDYSIETMEFGVPAFRSYVYVVRFVDPDNGNICYLTPAYDNRAGQGISCVKK